VDTSGQPVQRAIVTLSPEGTVITPARRAIAGPSIQTDTSGAFVLDAVEPGRYRLIAEKTGYVTQAYGAKTGSVEGTILDLRYAANVADVTIAMAALGVVSGRVLDDQGEPLRASNVRVYRRGYSRGAATLVGVTATTSDQAGGFKLMVPPGRYYVAAIPPRHAGTAPPTERYVTTYYPNAIDSSATIPIEVSAGAVFPATDIWLAKSRVVTLRGRVVGDVVPQVVILTPRGQYTPQAAVTAEPDAQGVFAVEAVAGRYTLVAASSTALAEVYGWTNVDVFDSDVDGVVVPTESLFTMRGSVRVIDGSRSAPATGVRVVLVPDEFPNAYSDARTDPDGALSLARLERTSYSLTLTGMPAGTYLAAVRVAGTSVGPGHLYLATTPARGTLEFDLEPNPGQVVGTVRTDDGKSTKAIVTLVPKTPRPGDDYLYRRVTTDDTGQFVVDDVAPHEYEVYAWDALEPDAEFSTDFLKAFDGTSVTVREGSQTTVALTLLRTGNAR
jgi:hypothetical protein